MKDKQMKTTRNFKSKAKALCMSVAAMVYSLAVQAQDGNAGINAATTQVKSYFAAGTNLMYAIGAITGLIGAVKVYNK